MHTHMSIRKWKALVLRLQNVQVGSGYCCEEFLLSWVAFVSSEEHGLFAGQS